jgi:LysM domain
MVDMSEPQVAAPAPVAPDVAAVCPYLIAADGRWRSASPAREHRCTAVSPPAVLAADKQRRLCLVADHVACATYQFATGQGDLIGATEDPRPDRVAGSGGRTIVRTAPLVLDHNRLALVVPTITADRRMGQAALLGLMAVAFAAILFARLSGTGPSQTPGLAGGVSGATASPASVASPDASGAPAASDGGAPVRTLVPTEVSPSPAPAASPAASGEPTTDPPATDPPTTYKVRRGDTLSGIAAEFGTTVAVLAELNDIDDPSRLRVGQVLDLP